MLALRQFGIYITVGVLCAVVDIGLMQLLIGFNVNYLVATTLGFACGFILNFLLHTNLTFSSRCTHRTLVRFTIVVLINFGITILVVAAFNTTLNMPLLGKLLSLPLVAVNGFLLGKHWIYT